MNKTTVLMFGAAVCLTAGCQNRVIFATHTSMGLDVSGTAQMPNKVSFSFERYEAAIVPRKTNGESHSVFGGMDADMTWFSGHTIKQTFATGEAAKLATGPSGGQPTGTNNKDKDPLIFFTATTYGLNLSVGEQSMSPNLLLGYRREEGAVIPVPDPAQEVRSVYADINISTQTNSSYVTTNFSSLGGVRIKQSFATGKAAEFVAASDPDVQAKLNSAAGTTINNLKRLQTRGTELSESVAQQVNRLTEAQLDQAGLALQQSGLALTTPADFTTFTNTAITSSFEKGRLLRAVAKNRKSPDEIAKLEKYLVELRDIK